MSVAINTAPIVDPRHMDFQYWAEVMCDQFATQQLEVPSKDTDWKKWANGLKAIDIFNNEGMPDASAFDNWHEWAEALVLTVNISRDA